MSGLPVASVKKKVVLKDDPYAHICGSLLEFRLTYWDVLLGASKGDTRARHKHDIRKVFHRQLKRLWEVSPILNESAGQVTLFAIGSTGPDIPPHRITSLAKEYTRCGYNFVPLATRAHYLHCDLEILFLRPDAPGGILSSGDIDNRLKTLFDALRLPHNLVD